MDQNLTAVAIGAGRQGSTNRKLRTYHSRVSRLSRDQAQLDAEHVSSALAGQTDRFPALETKMAAPPWTEGRRCRRLHRLRAWP
jgi:hypothetical protein